MHAMVCATVIATRALMCSDPMQESEAIEVHASRLRQHEAQQSGPATTPPVLVREGSTQWVAIMDEARQAEWFGLPPSPQ
ncbi:hypothetical protein ACLF3G_28230 [Falsiroseomonas sp. HC035]|uniref:hypothetical protein n=1 Tax=Falsiroseomonas sp. HC035 TaxID=3390999 RepID=UPI003D31CB0B